MVVLLLVLGPLGEHGHVLLAGNGLAEVDLVQVLLLVGEAGEVGNPVPAGEGVAIAGGLCGLAHHAVGVGETLLEGLAGGELAAVSRVEDVDLVLVGVLGPLGVDVHVGLHGLGEVHLVGGLLLVGVAGVVSVPVPAVEGVAIAGGSRGLAHNAVGAGNALHGIVAVSELATVSSVQDIDFALVLHPLGIHRCMRLGNRLSEIDLVLLFLLFGEDAQVGNPIPAGEGVAIAGGSRGLAHHAVRVGEALLNFLTVKELAAIGNIQNVGLVLYRFLLVGLVVHIKRADALQGGGHVHFLFAGRYA